MPEKIVVSEDFNHLLARERRRWLLLGIARTLVLLLMAGAVAWESFKDSNLARTLWPEQMVSATVTQLGKPGKNSRSVEYEYTIHGETHVGEGRIWLKPEKKVGDPVEVLVSISEPQISKPANGPGRMSPWMLLVGAVPVVWLYGWTMRWQSRQKMAPYVGRVRSILAAAVQNPEAPGDFSELLSYFEFRGTPLERLDGWSPDPRVGKFVANWELAQSTPVSVHSYLAHLYHADLVCNPREADAPAPPPTEAPIVTESFTTKPKEEDEDDDPETPEEAHWLRLAGGEADALVLDLAVFDEAAHRGATDDARRKLRKVSGISALFMSAEAREERARVLGMEIEWPPVGPLRFLSGDRQVAETMLNAREAIDFLDGTLLRFGYLPQPRTRLSGSGWLLILPEETEVLPIEFEYLPGRHFRVAVTGPRRPYPVVDAKG